jgi:hypothetical protein
MASQPHTKASARPQDAASSDNPPAAVEQNGHEPTEHRIQQRAYQIWVEEGKPDGRSMDHWLRARWELEQK